MSRIKARVAVQNSFGVPTKLLGAEEIRRLEPGLAESITGAIYTPLDGVVDHSATTRAYAQAATRLGAQILEGQTVREVQSGEDGVTLVTTVGGQTFGASRAVIILANYHGLEILRRSFSIDLPVWRYNPQATTVRSETGYTMTHLINHLTRRFSAKTVSGDLVMLTGNNGGTWDETTDSGLPSSQVTQASLRDAPELFPDMAGATVIDIDASRSDSVAVDDIPLIDRVPGTPSVFFGLGWSGHGFAIAPALARSLACWVRTGNQPPELNAFGVGRLSAQQDRAGDDLNLPSGVRSQAS